MSQELREKLNKANQDHYNESGAAQYEDDQKRALAKIVGTEILQFVHPAAKGDVQELEVEFDSGGTPPGHNDDIENVYAQFWKSEATKVLDFACGTGLVSEVLAPYVKQIIGVDISQAMVDLYNQKVYNQGIPTEEMAAYCLDICDDNVKHDHFSRDYFDAAVVSMAYHHLPDVRIVTKKIVSVLKPGGWLYVVDIEGHNHDHGHGPHKHEHQSDLAEAHFKFSEEDAAKHGVAHRGGLTAYSVMDAFENAGLELIGAQKAIKIKLWFEKERLPPFVQPDKLDSLSTRIGKDGKTLYLVRWHLMMVTGRKK